MTKGNLSKIILCFTLVLAIFSGCGQATKPTNKAENKQVEESGKDTKGKDIMLADIEKIFTKGMVKATEEEAKSKIGDNYITPKYIPERFKNYGTYISKEDPMVRQIWYDSNKLEMIVVTQIKHQSSSEPDREEPQILFADIAEDGKKMTEYHSWAKYRTQWEFTKKGISVQGYMLVNDENNRNEYDKILKSLKQ
ncbi:hypothetical protein [Clostridium magnum]|uniref:DUF4367 domain-containing protein n=1 Tax=Clostridium magnum DSM 2767 TaxID=1121326 RepID=A0A162QS57_9CLOT|nr:hypothetical protein [Clostridium magnum]KZL88894.1 hypothetical protein CLMAG_57980 [Clostridium magnum DSM 2767]SHI52239.1 hypothetical protein SAMN02745944_04444 [Clostridium magnum DSM 2767]